MDSADYDARDAEERAWEDGRNALADVLREACQTRIDQRGPEAVISCAFVLETLDGR